VDTRLLKFVLKVQAATILAAKSSDSLR